MRWLSRRCARGEGTSFDHLVGAGNQRRRDVQPEPSGSFQIDDQLKLNRLLNRQVARVFPFDNPINVSSRALKQNTEICAVYDQSADLGVFTKWVDGGKLASRHRCRDLGTLAEKQSIGRNQYSVRMCLIEVPQCP